MDLILPAAGTYQVDAYINGYSLNDCSILRRNDMIRPYFVTSVTNDPDVQGLTVFLRSSSGQVISQKTRYTLTPGLTTAEPVPVIPEPALPQGSTEPEPVVESPVLPEIEAPPVSQVPVPVEPEIPPELPVVIEPEPLVPIPAVEIEPHRELPEPPGEIPVIEIPMLEPVIETILPAQDEPEVPEESPETTESEVFFEVPPIPESEVPVISLEIPREIPAIERLEAKNNGLPASGEPERLISVTRLDQELPAYKLTDALEIGYYFLVFQVLGEKTVLYSMEKPVYFINDAVLRFDDIQRYLPGISNAAHFVPPGIEVLLEAQVVSDARLDPYVIWYSGTNRIGEGKLSEDARYLFWKVPERTGFHTVKAMLFPFKPPENMLLYGSSKELSLPVSAKSAIPGYFADRAVQFTHWYQFENNLLDAKNPGDPARRLRAATGQDPRWVPWGPIYGLSIGPEDTYFLPDSPLLLSGDEQGSGQILFRLVLQANGTIMKAVFTSDDTRADPLDMDLSLSEETLVLRLYSGDASSEVRLPPDAKDRDTQALTIGDFVALGITFSIQGAQFTAQVYLEDPGMASKPCTITLAAPLTGEGFLQYGSQQSLPALADTKQVSRSVALLDEVGVSFTKTPILPNREWSEPETEAVRAVFFNEMF
jgi:hypothetical protein